MSIDKTIIKISPIGFTQIVPNVANNVSELVYNEGIYIKSNSLSYTLPKSVVRIYKNQNNPKKIYLLSKDTSVIQAGSSYVSDTQTYTQVLSFPPTWNAQTVNEIEANANYGQFFSKETENLENYSKFEQPSNIKTLNFDDSSLNGKTINFYSLASSTEGYPEFSTLYSGSLRDYNSLAKHGYFLKSKSIMSDYSEDDSKYNDSLTILFNSAILQNFSKTSDLRILSESDVSLSKTVKISKASSIDFTKYVDTTYSNLWIQKVDNDFAPVDGLDGTYVVSTLIEDEWQALAIPDPTKFGYSGFSFEDGKSITSLLEKNIFISKKDEVISDYYLNRQLFKVPEPLENYRHFALTTDGVKDVVQGAIRQNTYDVFETQFKLNSNSFVSKYTAYGAYGSENRGDQVKEIETNPDLYLSTMYIMNNDFDYRNYPFFPDNINTKVYEFELQEVLDFENGTFVVVEIQ